jgi:hypothetical protein
LALYTSELAYVYCDLDIYSTYAFEFHPTASDYALAKRQSRSWSTFAYFGDPVGEGDTLKGWESAYEEGKGMIDAKVFVIGGEEFWVGGGVGCEGAG